MSTAHRRTISRRVQLWAAAGSAGAASLSLARCGWFAGGQSTPAPNGASVTLRLHAISSGAEGQYWPKVVDGFNARGTRVHVTFEPWPAGTGAGAAALAMAVAGTLGDVMRLVGFGGDYSQMAAKGFLKDMEPLIQHDRYNLKQFYAAAVDTLKFREKLYGLPQFAHPGFCGHFTNLDVLSQAGVVVPDEATWTLADLVDVAKRLTTSMSAAADNRWGMWTPTNLQHVMVAVRAFGGDTLSRDGKQSLISEPAAVQGIQFIADLLLKHQVAPPPGGLPGDAVTNFISGNVGTLWWNVGALNTLTNQGQGLRWRLLLGPKGPKSRGFFMGVDAISMNAASRYPTESFELMKYIVTKEVSLGWRDVGYPPGARPDNWNDPKVTADPAQKVFARAMDEAAPFNLPQNGLLGDYNAAIGAALNAVWSGKTSVPAGADEARRAGQEILNRA